MNSPWWRPFQFSTSAKERKGKTEKRFSTNEIQGLFHSTAVQPGPEGGNCLLRLFPILNFVWRDWDRGGRASDVPRFNLLLFSYCIGNCVANMTFLSLSISPFCPCMNGSSIADWVTVIEKETREGERALSVERHIIVDLFPMGDDVERQRGSLCLTVSLFSLCLPCQTIKGKERGLEGSWQTHTSASLSQSLINKLRPQTNGMGKQ